MDVSQQFGRAVEVLLIEDNPGDARLAQEFFNYCQTKVNLSLIASGDEAIPVLTSEDKLSRLAWPDLILLDLALPGLDGPEVLKLLRGDRRFAAVPIIVMTTSIWLDDIKYWYDLQANAYVTKPRELDELFDVFLAIEKFWLPGHYDRASC